MKKLKAFFVLLVVLSLGLSQAYSQEKTKEEIMMTLAIRLDEASKLLQTQEKQIDELKIQLDESNKKRMKLQDDITLLNGTLIGKQKEINELSSYQTTLEQQTIQLNEQFQIAETSYNNWQAKKWITYISIGVSCLAIGFGACEFYNFVTTGNLIFY